MSEIVDQSLQKIAKGTGIYFFGTIAGLLLAFASKIIVIRYITQSEYGILALVSVLASVFCLCCNRYPRARNGFNKTDRLLPGKG